MQKRYSELTEPFQNHENYAKSSKLYILWQRISNHIVLNLYSLRKTPYIVVFLHSAFTLSFSPDSVAPYSPEQIGIN